MSTHVKLPESVRILKFGVILNKYILTELLDNLTENIGHGHSWLQSSTNHLIIGGINKLPRRRHTRKKLNDTSRRINSRQLVTQTMVTETVRSVHEIFIYLLLFAEIR